MCELTEDQLRRRKSLILQKLSRSLIGFDELENGFSYRFSAEDAVLRELTEIVNLERKCCPFLDFKLFLAAGSDEIRLELTGDRGTKQVLGSLF